MASVVDLFVLFTQNLITEMTRTSGLLLAELATPQMLNPKPSAGREGERSRHCRIEGSLFCSWALRMRERIVRSNGIAGHIGWVEDVEYEFCSRLI